ncbi:MAG: hypothetical protein NTX98_00405 [Candidatus Doudnabacteria bacterium]|nr:hypothetical protein [Candidatus Doudnabacteria bacterium]
MINRFDPRARYRNLAFKKQLQTASGYRRPIRQIPKTNWGAFLKYTGLESWVTKTLWAVFFLLAAYLIYIPNFLFIKNIDIVGLNSEQGEKIKQKISNYFRIHRAWPQQNLILLSKPKLADYLLKDDAIYKVNKIEKNLFNGLKIYLIPRQEIYLLEIGERMFKVSNDGKIISETQSTSTLPSDLVLLKITRNPEEKKPEELLKPGLLNSIDQLKNFASQNVKNNFATFEFDPLAEQDLILRTSDNYKVLFDLRSDMKDAAKNLEFLLSQILPENKGRLLYIDMRIQDRGYVCYKNTDCAKETIFQNTASSTIETIKK